MRERCRTQQKEMYALQDTLLAHLRCAAVNAAPHDRQGAHAALFGASAASRQRMGYLHAPLRALDCMMMDPQPGSLAVQAGKLIGEREGELLRARLMREQLIKLVAD